MKVAWIHSFPPNKVSSGIFMHQLAEEIKNQGVDITMIYAGSLKNLGKLASNVRRIKTELVGYDIVHAQYGSGCGFFASQLKGPKLLTICGSDWYGSGKGSLNSQLHGVIAHHLTKFSLKKYDYLYVMSNRMKKSIERQNGNRHNIIEVLPSGINLEKFNPMDRFEARRQLGINDNTSPWVLFSTISLESPIKRVQLAQETIGLAKKMIPNLELKVLSGISHDQVPLYINACNAVLLTSTHEGWPNIIKESLACNIPFVSTDVGDLHCIAQKETNCHVVHADPESLSKALIKTIKSGERKNLRKYVESMDIKRVATSLTKRYKEIYLSHKCCRQSHN